MVKCYVAGEDDARNVLTSDSQPIRGKKSNKVVGRVFGSDQSIGAGSRAAGRNTPTYIYPEEVRWVVRARFPDDSLQLADGRVETQAAVYRVDVVDLASTRWPTCRCGAGQGGSQAGGPARRKRRQGTNGTPYQRQR
uniref:Uncharacterized protein n=1 Tax=Branchiostoma floridae TaxID=7739 RepID=C3ZGQ6_BRAFL|eukprot:XP_002592271.1 hypothetical protein BRAFLDRAFT_71002 [Branchiostoma floridae]